MRILKSIFGIYEKESVGSHTEYDRLSERGVREWQLFLGQL